MNVRDLTNALNRVDPETRVLFMLKHDPTTELEESVTGSPLYFAVSNIDGKDKLLVISNWVTDKAGNDIFKATPQFKRVCVSNANGRAAAIADLQEQFNCEPTEDLEELERLDFMRQITADFKSMLEKLNDKT